MGVDQPQAPRCRPRGLKMYQIMLVSRGRGKLLIGRESYELMAGDVFFLREGEPHEYYGVGSDFSTSWICFSGAGVEPLLSYYGITHGGLMTRKDYGNFEKKLVALDRAFDTDVSIPMMMARVYELVVTFFDDTFKVEYTNTEKIKNYIEKNFAEPLSLDDIFEGCKQSKSKLCREFKEKYGETVFEMLIRIRLDNAKKQLDGDPTLKVKDIAFACGFGDCSYFCRMYRRRFGKSPREDG